jgi:hypothetical protein
LLQQARSNPLAWWWAFLFAHWKDEIAWMSLYFSTAVWASLALRLVYLLGDQLPRYRTEAPAREPALVWIAEASHGDRPSSAILPLISVKD